MNSGPRCFGDDPLFFLWLLGAAVSEKAMSEERLTELRRTGHRYSTTTAQVYLVVCGDIESHTVLSAHLSFDHAEKSALERMKADDRKWCERSTEESEVYAWGVAGYRWRSDSDNGRDYEYFAIEAFELQDEGEWTLSYKPPLAEAEP